MAADTSKVISVTAGKIQAGAAKCPQAAAVLKEMFPEAFVDPTFDTDGRVKFGSYEHQHFAGSKRAGSICNAAGNPVVEARGGGNLVGKSLYLNMAYNWAIERDNTNQAVLVAYKK